MPGEISSSVVTQRAGIRYQSVRVAAEYRVSKVALDNMRPNALSRIAIAAQGPFRKLIERSVVRAYSKSRLGGTGRLLGSATRDFTVQMRGIGERVEMEALWSSPLPYFLRRQFGIPDSGVDALGRKLRSRGFDTIRKTSRFIQFDGIASREGQRILADLVAIELRGKILREERAEAAPPGTAKAEALARREAAVAQREAAAAQREARLTAVETIASPSGRVTPFRIRKAFRTPRGPLSAAQARQLAAILTADKIDPQLIAILLGTSREKPVRIARGIQVTLA